MIAFAASIYALSGGLLTLGIGAGIRPDNFVVPCHSTSDRGRGMDVDLRTYHEVWDGCAVGGGENPGVPAGTRCVPLLFGTQAKPALRTHGPPGRGLHRRIRAGRSKVGDYYAGLDDFTEMAVNEVNDTSERLLAAVKGFADLTSAADELILNPMTDDFDEVLRLADVVL